MNTFNQNQVAINEVNGNIMMWLASKQIDNEYQPAIQALQHQIKCEGCGKPEVIMHFPKYHSNLTDGLCEDCEMK